jgi:hypothetical protein
MPLPSGQQGFPLQQTPSAERSEYNAHRFAAEQILAKARTATLVKIKAVKSKGEVAAPGMVDVQPMVKLMDGKGNASSHGVVNNVLYYRYQAGSSAIIMDPKVGDVGFLVVADSDISSVKSSKQESNPGSWRKNALPDGVFFPALLGSSPTSYIQFTDGGNVVIDVKGKGHMVCFDTHVQMKKKGDPNLHVTVDIAGGQLIAGMDFVIAPDPYPND